MAPCSHCHKAVPRTPGVLHGRYKVYKKGTNKLIDFLISAAGRCCDLKAIISSLKNKILPKRASKEQPTLSLNTAELVKLAQVIADSDPPIDVPENVLAILRDVIAGREECNTWYASQAVHDGLELENEGHRYFIMILQRVLELLTRARAKFTSTRRSPKIGKEKKTSKSKNKPGVVVDAVSNLFSLLQVEEPSLSDEASSFSIPSTPPPAYFKLEKEDEDGAFETWCFLQDLNDVRVFVWNTWLEYSRGEISFLTASSVTDTAFGLLRCAEAEFAATSPTQSTNWKDILVYLGLSFFTRDRVVWLCPNEPGRTPKIRSEVNIVELLCPIANHCLYSYILDAGEVYTSMAQGKYGAKPKPSTAHAMHEFCCVLWKLAAELHALAYQHSCEHLVIDEFVQGLTEIHRTGITPMWVVVACQIYLDLYDLLGSHISHGVDALEATFKKHKQIGETIQIFRQANLYAMSDVSTAFATLDWVAKALNRFEEATFIPAAGRHERASKKHTRIREELGCSASDMERSLPAHSGAILADLKIGMHKAGTYIANHDFYILTMAHVYKAFRAMDVLQDEWKDMDTVLPMFGSSPSLFPKTGVPYDTNAAVRYLFASLGMPMSVSLLTDVRKRDAALKSAFEKARRIRITSPLLQSLSDKQQSWQKCGLGYSKSKTVEVVLDTLTAQKEGQTW